MAVLIFRTSVTGGHLAWTARFHTYTLSGSERAKGSIYHAGRHVRDFDVAVRNNHIAVDIGTGSGVKVRFRVEERH